MPIGSVVTIGGLAAIALSLAAQNFVRDFLNGYLVLYEDQYVVGDYVTINAFSGNVEVLTLRMVQIRDAAGDLITIPHSSVVNVINQSRNWSRIDYHVPIDPGADVPRAIEIVRAQIEALAREGDALSPRHCANSSCAGRSTNGYAPRFYRPGLPTARRLRPRRPPRAAAPPSPS